MAPSANLSKCQIKNMRVDNVRQKQVHPKGNVSSYLPDLVSKYGVRYGRSFTTTALTNALVDIR